MERDKMIASGLSILHWDNGCKHCPLIEECKKADEECKKANENKIKGCDGIWYDWLKHEIKCFEE